VLSPNFVATILGSKWEAAIPVMQALAVFGIARSLLANVGEVYKSVGRPDITAKIHFVWLLALSPALALATRYGIVGVGVAETLVIVLLSPFYVLFLLRMLQLRWPDLLKAVYPGALSSLVLFGVLVLVQGFIFKVMVVHGLVNLIVSGFVAIFTYLLVSFFISRNTLLEVGALLASLLRAAPTVSASQRPML